MSVQVDGDAAVPLKKAVNRHNGSCDVFPVPAITEATQACYAGVCCMQYKWAENTFKNFLDSERFTADNMGLRFLQLLLMQDCSSVTVHY